MLIALAASCALQEPAAPEQDQFPTLSACFENAATKASLAADQAQVVWDANDQIAVFYRTNKSVCYALKGEAGSSSATFAYASGFAAGEPIPYICGFYPYSRDVSLTTDGDFSFEWPAEQVYAEAGFGPGSNPMVAVSESETLYFKNIGGYLVVPIWGEGAAIQSVTLMGANEEPLAGPAVVYAGPESEPSVYMADGAVSEVVLKCTEPVTVGETEDEATEFWFVIPPTVFEEGFGIKIAYADGTEQEVWAESPNEYYEVSRNTVFRMDALCITPEEVPYLFSEDFEDNFAEERMPGWTFVDNDGDGYEWYFTEDDDPAIQKHSGIGLLQSQSYDNPTYSVLTPDNWAITPAFQLSSTENWLSFWVIGQDPSYAAEHFAAYIIAGAPSDDIEDYTLLYEGNAKAIYQQIVAEIPSDFNGKVVRLMFRHYNVSDMFILNLDDIAVTEEEPEVDEPDNPHVDPDAPEGMNYLFEEYLDDYQNLDGWGILDYDGDGVYWGIYQPGVNGNGYNFFSESYSDSYGALEPDNWLFTPAFTLSSDANYLSFWVAPYSSYYYEEHYAVYVAAGDFNDVIEGEVEFDEANYKLLFEETFGDTEPVKVSDDDWYRFIVEIPASLGLNGEEVHIAFRHYDCTDEWALQLDDITVTDMYPIASGPSPAPAHNTAARKIVKAPVFAPTAPVSKNDIPVPARIPFSGFRVKK